MATDPVKQLYADRQVQCLKDIKEYKAPRQNFRASELEQCRLRVWYRLSGYIPAARTPRGDDYGHDGDMHHDQVRNQMRAAGMKLGGLTFNKDKTVTENDSYVLEIKHKGQAFKISMRLDGTITLGTMKHTLEIKSLGFWKYKPFREVWTQTESMAAVTGYMMSNRRDIVYQVHANMMATKLKRAYVLLKDRSDCALGLHSDKKPEVVLGGVIVEFDPVIWDEILNRMAYITKKLQAKEAPEPDHQIEVNECKTYCGYYHMCHGANKRRKRGLEPVYLHPQLGTKLHVEEGYNT